VNLPDLADVLQVNIAGKVKVVFRVHFCLFDFSHGLFALPLRDLLPGMLYHPGECHQTAAGTFGSIRSADFNVEYFAGVYPGNNFLQ